MVRGTRLRAALVTLVALAAALLLAACGSSSDDGGSSTGSTGSGDGGAATTSGGSDAKAAAQRLVDAASGPVAFESPGEAFDISSARGKTIWIVCNDTSLPFVQAVLRGFDQAAKIAGVNVKLFNAKGQSNAAAQGIDQAVAAKAGAISVFGISLRYVTKAVEDAKAAGIPVVGALNVDVAAPLEPNAAGEVSIDYVKSGELIAAYAIANTDGPVNALYQNLPGIDTFAAMKEGVEKGIATCSDCKLTSVDFTGDFKGSEMTQTPSALARDPKLNWIIPAIDGMAQFAVPAVESAGKGDSVRIGSINAVASNLKLIQEGRVQAVDVGNNNQWFGWAMVDRSLRAIAGQEPATSTVPIKLFDARNLEGQDIEDEDALFSGVDYRAEYQKLWKK